ncbi:MAG: hypothetical protein K0T99_02320 [Alphaproteobacteria bacterium]|nr:hypothetical protein [Alphaproteobacteria bacterium]
MVALSEHNKNVLGDTLRCVAAEVGDLSKTIEAAEKDPLCQKFNTLHSGRSLKLTTQQQYEITLNMKNGNELSEKILYAESICNHIMSKFSYEDQIYEPGYGEILYKFFIDSSYQPPLFTWSDDHYYHFFTIREYFAFDTFCRDYPSDKYISEMVGMIENENF